MMNENDSAFPNSYSSGLTIREYFAAKALQGLLANPNIDFMPFDWAKEIPLDWAKEAIYHADALIMLLNEKEEDDD